MPTHTVQLTQVKAELTKARRENTNLKKKFQHEEDKRNVLASKYSSTRWELKAANERIKNILRDWKLDENELAKVRKELTFEQGRYRRAFIAACTFLVTSVIFFLW